MAAAAKVEAPSSMTTDATVVLREAPHHHRSSRRDEGHRREQDRSRDRRDQDRDRNSKDRHNSSRGIRSRSRSPLLGGGCRRSHSTSSNDSSKQSKSAVSGAVPKALFERPKITDADLEGKSEEELAMIKLMGFGTFDSTHNKKVVGNEVSAVNLLQKRKYCQYMNRKGGFNRPLDFAA
ncbi:U4/U6.U5 small nuclear ribonucleoprotein [Tyrophagus putrescentiae]|nr:U4/U6.U5 small nuclear ribonucleoprotein [Tyrophagus putrescentiae]